MSKRAPKARTTDQEKLTNLGHVDVEVSIELGRTRLPINTLLGWVEGSVLELSRTTDQPVDVKVDGEPFAEGEVVAVGEHYGVRILKLVNEDPDND